MQLYEWSDEIGEDKAVRTIPELVRRGIGGRALWVTGRSGQGKSTIARLVSTEIEVGFCTFELPKMPPIGVNRCWSWHPLKYTIRCGMMTYCEWVESFGTQRSLVQIQSPRLRDWCSELSDHRRLE